MKLPSLLLIACLVSFSSAHAVTSSSTSERCSTQYTKYKPWKVETTSKFITVTETCTRTISTHSTITIKPPRATSTVTASTDLTTTYTAPQSTDTITGTDTLTVTDFESTTVTETSDTSTTTTTTTTPTYTVPTPAGFTPIRSDPDYVAKKRSEPMKPHLSKPRKQSDSIDSRVYGSRYSLGYPSIVTCDVKVHIKITKEIYAPGHPIIYHVPRKTITKTRTITVSDTITQHPTDATSTTTITTFTSTSVTSTSDTTLSVTSTSTETDTAPTATVYAACNPELLVSTANGGFPISIIINSKGLGLIIIPNIDSAVACCVKCQTTTNCGGSAYNSVEGCYIAIQDTCDPSSNTNGPGFETGAATDSPYFIGNGPCGQIQNRGSEFVVPP